MESSAQQEIDARFSDLVLDVEELESLVTPGWWKDFSGGFKTGFTAVAAGGTVVGIGVGIGVAVT